MVTVHPRSSGALPSGVSGGDRLEAVDQRQRHRIDDRRQVGGEVELKAGEGQPHAERVVHRVIPRGTKRSQEGVSSDVANAVLGIEPDPATGGDDGCRVQEDILEAEVELVHIVELEVFALQRIGT